ncbi:MAG: kelch repeat-containing protein [Planctomycetota bacterium]
MASPNLSLRRSRSPSLLPLATLTATLLVATGRTQSNWVALNPTAPGQFRLAAAAASDGTRIWVFGGFDTSALGDTWDFDGQTWTEHFPAGSPPPRYAHAMAYDGARSLAVVFGGVGATSAALDDTWEWNGNTWTQRLPSVRPSARSEHAMAYDPLRGRTVLFGGTSGSAETWEWDGTNWQLMTPSQSPPPRNGHGMAFHRESAKVVLFGGISSSIYNDTWEWDGTNWTQRLPAHVPPARFYAQMCHDPGRDRVVVFSGRPNYLQDTWEWDGHDWTQRNPTSSPAARHGAILASDRNGRPILFSGGRLRTSMQYFGDTVALQAASATFRRFGNGCAGSNGVPQVQGDPSPFLGTTWDLTVTSLAQNAPTLAAIGASDAQWNGLALPFDMTAFGMPGCGLAVSVDVMPALSVQGSTATLSVPVPTVPQLAGSDLFVQAVVLDASANPLGVVLSNAGALHFAAL